MKLFLFLILLSLGACTSQDCTCTINGTKYAIKQNSKGMVYGVPVQ